MDRTVRKFTSHKNADTFQNWEKVLRPDEPIMDDTDLKWRTELIFQIDSQIEKSGDPDHYLSELSDKVCALIEAYEIKHYPMPGNSRRVQLREKARLIMERYKNVLRKLAK